MNYSAERNVQMVIYLMKKHGIRKVVASPGTTNINLVASIQQDPYFEMYSSADERSAAYIACGLAAESGKPVALTCTGSTASRNYLPGLTEAFYRKLPILAITATQPSVRLGQLIPQTIDRRKQPNDIVKMSIQVPMIHDAEDEWGYGVMINTALLELKHRGGGPVHINLETKYSNDFSVKEISPVKTINRICIDDDLPEIKAKNVGIFVGAHQQWNERLTSAVEGFCAKYNGVVFCDLTSNYFGKHRISPHIVCSQDSYKTPLSSPELIIHIGEISGSYLALTPKEVWRVNPDGEIRDTFQKLTYVFEMQELRFFESYNDLSESVSEEYYITWKKECDRFKDKLPDAPFSNLWVARNTISKLSEDNVIHFGILNSLRSWNFFSYLTTIRGYSNTGGFGIDGCTSSLVGASLADKEKLFYGVVGDLSFFYDMNSIGNRHIGKNLRLMVINNGTGIEFRNYNHRAAFLGEDADLYVAASGHYGNKSHKLLQHYAEDLGFEYLCASDKVEFQNSVDRFTVAEITEKPMIFEVFTSSEDESKALQMIRTIEKSTGNTIKQQIKKIARNILGEKGVKVMKKFIKM